MAKNIYIISSALGNATAIEIIPKRLNRQEYVRRGKKLMSATKIYGVEQCGFLILDKKHLEMSGGEFCGNAARAAALVIHLLTKAKQCEFSMSGFSHIIKAKVKKINIHQYKVECLFPNFKIKIKPLKLMGKEASLIDLGGITHVVIKDDFPKKDYKTQHKNIRQLLKLKTQNAIGVCWIKKNKKSIKIHPVVWVKQINSFFYESSCGSGSIAVSKANGLSKIIQPSGSTIYALHKPKGISLQSRMDIIKIIS